MWILTYTHTYEHLHLIKHKELGWWWWLRVIVWVSACSVPVREKGVGTSLSPPSHAQLALPWQKQPKALVSCICFHNWCACLFMVYVHVWKKNRTEYHDGHFTWSVKDHFKKQNERREVRYTFQVCLYWPLDLSGWIQWK